MRCPLRIIRQILILCLAFATVGCAGQVSSRGSAGSRLIPTPSKLDQDYSLKEDNTVVYRGRRIQVTVKFLADEDLKALFPQQPTEVEASINPYTYGNWLDPHLGVTPSRFTVCKVTVHNQARPKINLNPAQVLLITDRGDSLHAYLAEATEIDRLSFEDYYLERMGPGQEEGARYDKRMDRVRQTLYLNGPVSEGEVKEGLLAFDPLDPRVKRVQLILKDFVLRYDAEDWPVESIDLRFPFERTKGE